MTPRSLHFRTLITQIIIAIAALLTLAMLLLFPRSCFVYDGFGRIRTDIDYLKSGEALYVDDLSTVFLVSAVFLITWFWTELGDLVEHLRRLS